MNITCAAHTQIDLICQPGSHFRIQVQAGGCSGFAHEFSICSKSDQTQDVHMGRVVMDVITADILQHAQLDWRSDLSGEQFVLHIPNTTSQCGCGKSFSLF